MTLPSTYWSDKYSTLLEPRLSCRPKDASSIHSDSILARQTDHFANDQEMQDIHEEDEDPMRL